MTYDDLLYYVKYVHNYNFENPSDKIAAFCDSRDFTLMFMFQNLIKSEIDDINAFNNEIFNTKNIEALKKVLKTSEELSQYDPLVESHFINIWSDNVKIILNDKALFYIDDTRIYNKWRSVDKENFYKLRPAELPVYKDVHFCMGSYFSPFAVFKNAPNKENAVELILFWSSPKVGKKWIKYTKCPTGVYTGIKKTGFNTDIYENYVSKMSQKYGQNIHVAYNTGYLFGPNNRRLEIILSENIREILSRQIDADEAYLNIINNLVE